VEHEQKLRSIHSSAGVLTEGVRSAEENRGMPIEAEEQPWGLRCTFPVQKGQKGGEGNEYGMQ